MDWFPSEKTTREMDYSTINEEFWDSGGNPVRTFFDREGRDVRSSVTYTVYRSRVY